MVQTEAPHGESFVSGVGGMGTSFANGFQDREDANRSTDRMTALLAEAEALLAETAEAAAPFFGGTAAWAFDSPCGETLGYYSCVGQTGTAMPCSREQAAVQPRSVSFQSEER